MSNQTAYLTFFLYFVIVFVIGWRASRQTHNQSDYLLGGRKLGPWVSAMSAGASDMSGWLLLGLPGYAYLAGIQSIWLVIGLFIGTWLNWHLIAPALRKQSEQANDSITLPDFFAHRFPEQALIIRLVSALFILIFYLFYTSSGLVASGKLFESVFGFDYVWSVYLGTLVILIYTCLGGFLAVSWTDLFQALLMMFALVITVLISVNMLGGTSVYIEQLYTSNPELINPFTSASGETLSIITIISLLGWGLGYFGQPHILVRFMAIHSLSDIPRARTMAISWSAICLIAAVCIGLSGLTLLQSGLNEHDSEQVFLKLIPLLFHPVIAGICLAAILAAIMSTADSQLLVASSAITEDLYQAIGKKPDDDRQVLHSRIAVCLISLIAMALAVNPENKILDLVAYAWSGFGASFGPALLFTLFWKKSHGTGILAGILIGGLTVILWKHFGDLLIPNVNEIIPGFILAAAVIYLICIQKN